MKIIENNSMSARIRAMRKKRGLTQQQLAELIGTSQQVLQRYESDEKAGNKLIRDNYINLAKHLDVSLQWLLTGIDDNQGATSHVISIPILDWSVLSEWFANKDQTSSTEWLTVDRAYSKDCIAVCLEKDIHQFKALDIIIIDTALQPCDGDYALIKVTEEPTSFFCIMMYGTSLTAVSSLQVVGVFVGLHRQLK